MEAGAAFYLVLTISLVLVAGAVLRWGLQALGLRAPYSLLLMVLGLACGLALDWATRGVDTGTGGPGVLSGLVDYLGAEDGFAGAEVLLLVLLPALVFESAFRLNLHAFRKNLAGIVLLAVPALVVTAGLVAMAGVWITSYGWSWQWTLGTALVFGGLISATDPVAVVSVMREMGAPVRLGVLVEGESLLNDGTAIVLFGVLTTMLAAQGDGGAGGGVRWGWAGMEFVRVVAGGALTGAILAAGVSAVLRRIYNDALVEITLTIALAYLAMIVADKVFGVSGVIAVVVAGLWMSGPGRTSITPEVMRFLEELWEMISYVANTVVFFMVGLVIALQVEWPFGLPDLATVVLVFVVVTGVRFAVVFAFRPLMRMAGERVSAREGIVLSWCGLRGAVALALALVFKHSEIASPPVRDTVLLATAGVVFFSILVYGSTARWLVGKLGLNRLTPGHELMRRQASVSALQRVRDRVREAALTPDLRAMPWRRVEEGLLRRQRRAEEQVRVLGETLDAAGDAAREAAYWERALRVERQACWDAFGRGMLSANALSSLMQEISRQLDRVGEGVLAAPETRVPEMSAMRTGFSRWLRKLGVRFGGLRFAELTFLYEMAWGQSRAAGFVLRRLRKLGGCDDDPVRNRVIDAYQQLHRRGIEHLERLRMDLPEVCLAIETRMARRLELAAEKEEFLRLRRAGVVSKATAEEALGGVDKRVKRLERSPRRIAPLAMRDMLGALPPFRSLRQPALAEVADLAEEVFFPAGSVLFREGAVGENLFIVLRGAVCLRKSEEGGQALIETLGRGEILGVVSLLTGDPLAASAVAATDASAVRIGREDFEGLIARQPVVGAAVREAFVEHEFALFLRGRDGFRSLPHALRDQWIASAEARELSAGQRLDPGDAAYVFIAQGELVMDDGSRFAAPALVEPWRHRILEAKENTLVALLPTKPWTVG